METRDGQSSEQTRNFRAPKTREKSTDVTEQFVDKLIDAAGSTVGAGTIFMKDPYNKLRPNGETTTQEKKPEPPTKK
jgi:hypothetical protein